MRNKEKMELAKWAVSKALQAGSDQVAVTIGRTRDVEIEYRDRKIEKLQESTQNGLSLQIYIDHRFSSHSTSDLSKESLDKFISEAVAGTKYLARDEYRSLPDPELYPKDLSLDLSLTDKDYPNVQPEDRIKIVQELEQSAREGSDRIISATASYSDSEAESVRVHSNGLEAENQSTIFSMAAEVTVKDDNGARPEDYDYAVSRYFKKLPGPGEIGKQARQRALGKLGQRKIDSGKYPMIVENRSAGRLIGMLQQPMSARALQQKSSFLDGKLGQQIASPLLTIIDDPFIPGGLGSKLFDGEGLATQKRTLIEKGVLKSYLIDYYYGKKLGMKPNSGSPSNLLFELGEKSAEELMRQVGSGILVTGFIGGNSNSTTGDFSFGIVGQLFRDGEIVHPVNEMNVTGNAIDFWNKLIALGNDPYPYSSLQSPTLVFEDVNFSGN